MNITEDASVRRLNVDSEHLKEAIRQRASMRQVHLHPVVAAIRGRATQRAAEPSHQPAASSSWSPIASRVENLKSAAHVGLTVPPLRHKRGLGRTLARKLAKLGRYLSRFVTQEQNQFNSNAAEVLHSVCLLAAEQERRFAEREKSFADTERRLSEQQQRSAEHDKYRAEIERRLRKHEQELSEQQQTTQEENRRAAEREQRLLHGEQLLAEHGQRLLQYEQRLADQQQGLNLREQRLNEHLAEHWQSIAELKARLRCQEERLSQLLEKAAGLQPASEAKTSSNIENNPALDALYLEFENAFRGSRELIEKRLTVYMPLLRELPASGQILDIGCGRGEWLELLRAENMPACGVDSNRLMTALCEQRGLDVTHADVLDYLRRLPDASLRALTGFHIVEHLPFRSLVALIDEARRVVQPGGVVIFETPNPRNMQVAARTFYLDPTHLHPLPDELLRFLLEARGLSRVQVMPLHPYPEECRLQGSEVAEQFSASWYGPQDYAVVGWKA